MATALTGNDAAVAAALEASTVEYWRTVCRHIPDARFYHGPDATWFITGLPFFPFNQVLRASFTPDGADARIDALLARAAGLPFCWNVEPASEPPDLAERLAARAPDRTNSMPGMALDLSQEPGPPPARDGFAIERVRDAAGLDRWAQTYRDAFDLPPAFVAALRDVYAAVGFDHDAPIRHYLGRLTGAAERPVASCTVFLAAGVANLWHIGTLPQARGLGAGAAMTLAPLPDARAAGCSHAVLFASDMGAPLYRRLGFRRVVQIEQFGWGESL